MWILFRLLVASGAFVFKFFRFRTSKIEEQIHNGVKYFISFQKNKGNIISFEIGIELKSNIIFKIDKENAFDRFFKKIGLVEEFQTGDEKFDPHVYIASDHIGLHTIISEKKHIRTIISNTLRNGVNKIYSDGEKLWLKVIANKTPNYKEINSLLFLKNAFEDAGIDLPSQFKDPFIWKVLLIESIIWAIFGYAIGGAIELFFRKGDLYVSNSILIYTGLFYALIAFIILIFLILLVLKRSSRGHRIITESFIVLLISLPTSSIQAVSDLNISLDKSETKVINETVLKTEKRVHRSKGSRYYTYHLYITKNTPILPAVVDVNYSIYSKADGLYKPTAEFYIAKGWLNIPWYKEILIYYSPHGNRVK